MRRRKPPFVKCAIRVCIPFDNNLKFVDLVGTLVHDMVHAHLWVFGCMGSQCLGNILNTH